MADIVIEPYVGAGLIRFGMRAREVSLALGKSTYSDANFIGELEEEYSDYLVTYDKSSGRVVELGFGRTTRMLKYDSLYLFQDNPLVVCARLCADDAQPYYYLGFVVLLNLGISLCGFHDASDEDMAVTAFDRGRWDRHRSKLQPFNYDRKG